MECIIIDDDQVSIKMIQYLIQKTEDLELVRAFEDPIEAINYLNHRPVDLLFLDVEMPGMTGLEMINSLQVKPLVILVSGKSDYALDAFEFDAVDYLLKPVQYGRFAKALAKVRERLQGRQEDGPGKDGSGDELVLKGDFIFVKSDSMLVRVNMSDILWVEALADYIALVTPKKRYVIHSTMKSIQARLPTDKFLRVHRSYIVRLDKIDAIEDNTIIIETKMIPVGGTYRERLMNALDFI